MRTSALALTVVVVLSLGIPAQAQIPIPDGFPDASTTGIAAQCGFVYPSRFSVTFNRHAGVTCTAYRSQFRLT